MAYGFDPNNPAMPCPEGKMRINRSHSLATSMSKFHRVLMVLGAQKAGKATPTPAHALAEVSLVYLQTLGWDTRDIRACPIGFNSPTELIAARRIVDALGGIPHAVTSWWHVPRVWLTAWVVFGKPIRVSASRTTLRRQRFWRILASETVKVFLCVPHAILARRNFRPTRNCAAAGAS